MDILCGPLSGAQFGPYLNNMWNDFVNPQDVGHIFCAIDISKFVDLETFKDNVEKMASDIKSLPKNPGVEEIFLPGEIEVGRMKTAREKGIQLTDVIYNELKEQGRLYGVEMDF